MCKSEIALSCCLTVSKLDGRIDSFLDPIGIYRVVDGSKVRLFVAGIAKFLLDKCSVVKKFDTLALFLQESHHADEVMIMGEEHERIESVDITPGLNY